MSEQTITRTQPSQRRSTTTALVQLVIAIGASFWAWQSRKAALDEETVLGAGFWGLVALALFCGTLGIFNLLMPWLRSSFNQQRDEPQRYAVRLQSTSGNWEVMRELFALGIAFFAPVIPLALMAFRMNQANNDFTLLGVGATLVCLVASGIMLLLTTSNVYTMLVAGRTIVEIDARRLEAGISVPVYASFEPGRLTPRNLRLRVVCRESGGRILLPQRQRRFGSRRVTVVEQYSDDICVQSITDAVAWPWECATSFGLPDNATPSSTSDQLTNPVGQRHIIDWAIELKVDIAMAPNFTIVFPIKVE